MKIPIPPIYDRIMDRIALILFPSRKYVTPTLWFYTVVMAVGLSWYFGSWLWGLAVIASMLLVWIMLEWM